MVVNSRRPCSKSDLRSQTRAMAETIQRFRLAQLSHSENDLAEAIATSVSLFLHRLDRLMEAAA